MSVAIVRIDGIDLPVSRIWLAEGQIHVAADAMGRKATIDENGPLTLFAPDGSIVAASGKRGPDRPIKVRRRDHLTLTWSWDIESVQPRQP